MTHTIDKSKLDRYISELDGKIALLKRLSVRGDRIYGTQAISEFNRLMAERNAIVSIYNCLVKIK